MTRHNGQCQCPWCSRSRRLYREAMARQAAEAERQMIEEETKS